MDIERFDPATDDAAVRACHEVFLAAARADKVRRPNLPLRAFRGWLTYGWTGAPSEIWLARDGAAGICGYYVLALPDRENRHTADLGLVVHPARRRAGVGTALVAHAAGRARQAGRTLVTSSTDEPAVDGPSADEPSADEPSAGQAFARALGATHRGTGIFRELWLASVPDGRLAALRNRAQAAARGYSLLSWDGPTPEEHLDAVIALCDAENDAPRAPGQEAELWDAVRVRADEARIKAQGLRWYSIAARPQAGGQAVAITQLAVDPGHPGWGLQELTAVVRPHRGHRLGLLLKLAMLDLLAEREPQVTRILTHNADGNQHMIAINAELGFEILERNLDWELETARLPTLADLASHAPAEAQS